MSNIKAVIFDLDGTLIDTEKYYRVAWPAAAKHFGYDMSDDQSLLLRSLGQPFAPAQFKEWFGPDCNYEEIKNYRKKLMNDILEKNGIELKPGAMEILNYLKSNGFLTAMATANPYDRTVKYLKQLELYDYFDKIICATMVKEGKPSPDVYDYSCKELNLSPDECIAVEDSPNGVLSAYRAGCKVIMIPDQSQPDEELIRCLYAKCDTLSDIKNYLI